MSVVIKELYGPLEEAVKGTLTGPGTLGTVVLCESLLSFLPSGSPLDQPTYVFRANDILPLGKLQMSRRVDLGRFGTINSGVLYIRRPALQRIWLPAAAFLSTSASATAMKLVRFLDRLRAGRQTADAVQRAASIVVEQFKYDLKEMGVVQDLQLLSGRGVLHGCIRDAQMADEYVSKVFVPEHLPACMTTKAFLSMALDLFDPSALHARIIDNLLSQTKAVPTAIVHARAVHFSWAFRTVLIRGPLFAAPVSPLDAQRPVIAATQLLDDNFTLSRKEMNAV